ncbi:MAG TPA: type IV pilus assembly protein PilM [Thermoanaerobaculia bacterium]|nr:type IV pilus assembly protein PilM [Thermoanaerobaculia bacterium]
MVGIIVLFRKSKSLVGLDIGSSAVKLVELKDAKGGGYRLVKTGIELLSPEAIVDGAIMDASLVVDAVNRVIAALNVRNNDFGTSLSGHAVIVKKVSLPAMSAEELAESIRWEAEQYVPFDINDVNLDYVVLEPGGGDTMDVLLVAVKKDKIGDYTSVITQAGKTPVLVDVDAFALQNAWEVNYPVEPGRVVALINIGASVTNVNVLSGGNTIFWRDISVGGNQYTDAIQKQLTLSFEQADALKKGEPVADHSLQEILPIIKSVSDDLAQELQKTFDFFIATTSTEKIDQLFLAGGCSRIVHLDRQLKERFGIPVEIMNPFRQIDTDGSAVSAEWLNENAPSLAVAVGLAVRHIGDEAA